MNIYQIKNIFLYDNDNKNLERIIQNAFSVWVLSSFFRFFLNRILVKNNDRASENDDVYASSYSLDDHDIIILSSSYSCVY